MPGMVPSIKKQRLIHAWREQVVAQYASAWARITSDWNSPGPGERVWFLYGANYLFRTAGVRWVIDPLMLSRRVPDAPPVEPAKDLRGLSFVILTHRHADHLDLDMLRSLQDLPIRFIIPKFMLGEVLGQTKIPEKNVIIPVPLQKIEVNSINITPFEGLHWEKDISVPGELRGVPELGYLIEFSGKRWLFPGDTRNYEAAQLPNFGPVDGLFAHLWLGRKSALLEPPPLLDAFCRFCLDLQPGRIVLTHLHEFGRGPLSYWDDSHASFAAARLQEISPGTPVVRAHMGEFLDI